MSVHQDPTPFERVDANLQIGRRWIHYPSVASTNAVAAGLAGDLSNHGLIITAGSQTAGRGQYDRTWSTPPDSAILMSVLLFPPPEIRRASILTAWAAVSVCEAIRIATGLESTIKWPNDVLVAGQKVCGILCEGGARHVVAGIGLNLNQTVEDFERLSLPHATSLSIASGSHFQLAEMTEQLVRQLDAEYSRLTQGNSVDVESAWKEGIGLLGESVEIERMDGSISRGRLGGLSFSGVELKTEDGSRTILPPEVIRHMRRDDPTNRTGL